MDSSWYAVDKNGQVALFHTGAGGAVPHDAYSPEAGELLEDLDLDPATLEEMGVDVEEVEEIAQQLPNHHRLFVYETGPMDECFSDRYERKQAPKVPLHIDELPPQVRQAVGGMRFDTLDFGQTKRFQPVELTECATWDPAYLADDGKTIKPVPGREKEYAEFVKGCRDDLVGDGLTVEEPAKPKRSPRKKKESGGEK
jgi:hypothetical protein